MIFTFFKARGMGVGSSLVEEDNLDLAKRLESLAKDKGEQCAPACRMKLSYSAAQHCMAEQYKEESAQEYKQLVSKLNYLVDRRS